MSEFDSLYQRNLYLSPDQQDLLVAALSSQNPASKPQKSGSASISKPEPKPSPKMRSSSRSSNGGLTESPSKETPGSGHLEFGNEESPFLDFDLDVDFDANGMDDLIGDLPDSIANDETESREKRKSIDESEPDESGNKRRESEDRLAKKPGRKPLTSEPTTVSLSGLSFSLLLLPFFNRSISTVLGKVHRLTVYRNVKHRTELPSGLLENARKNMLRIWKLKLKSLRNAQNQPAMRTLFCAPRWSDSRSNLKNIANVSRGLTTQIT